MFRSLKQDPNHIYVMCIPNSHKPSTRPSSPTKSKMQHAKSFARRFTLHNDHDNSNQKSKIQLYTFVAAIGAMLFIIHTLAISDKGNNSDSGGGNGLRFSFNNNNNKKEPKRACRQEQQILLFQNQIPLRRDMDQFTTPRLGKETEKIP